MFKNKFRSGIEKAKNHARKLKNEVMALYFDILVNKKR